MLVWFFSYPNLVRCYWVYPFLFEIIHSHRFFFNRFSCLFTELSAVLHRRSTSVCFPFLEQWATRSATDSWTPPPWCEWPEPGTRCRRSSFARFVPPTPTSSVSIAVFMFFLCVFSKTITNFIPLLTTINQWIYQFIIQFGAVFILFLLLDCIFVRYF